MWDKQRRWNTEHADLSYISEYTPEMVDKRINYHNKKNSSLKWKPSQIMIKGWLKTIKAINCNFHAISESRECALAASYFQTLLFRVKTVCHLILIQTFPASERDNTHQQFEGCNCYSVIKKERWTTRVQSVDLRKEKKHHLGSLKCWFWVGYYYKNTLRASSSTISSVLVFIVTFIVYIKIESWNFKCSYWVWLKIYS